MAKNLWTAYLIWLLVPLLGWLASATEVFELGACSRFSVATLLTLSGGFVLIANSLRSGNRNSYSNWDRWLTTAMTIVATASIAFLTLSSCTSPIPPDSYSYIVRVYDATTNTPFQEVVASVKVFVGGEKFEGNSGSDGIATVLIPNQYRNRQAQLEVTANGYQAHRDQAHSLNSDTHDVFLLRLEGTPTVPSTITSNQIEDTPPVMLEPNTIGPTPLPTSTTTPTLIVRVPPTPIIQPSPGVSTPLVQLSNTFPPPSPQDSENNGSTPTKSVEPAVPTPVPTSTLMPPEDVTPPTMAPLALNPLPTSPTSVTISPPPTLIAPELATPPLMPPESVTPTLISPESATPPLIQP